MGQGIASGGAIRISGVLVSGTLGLDSSPNDPGESVVQAEFLKRLCIKEVELEPGQRL